MQPRLRLDIGWSDLASIWLPVLKPRTALVDGIARHSPADAFTVVGLSVRSLFLALLQEAGSARPVAMSAVTVEDMAALARTCGCSMRPVDVEMDALLPAPDALLQACGDDAGLIVLAHLYGGRGSVEAIAARCSAPDRLIVEDCAQAFDGTLRLSPGADVALYSFGPIKTATALGGAVGLFRDKALADRVQRRMADWPALGDGWFLRRALKYAALKLIGTPPIFGLFMALLTRLADDPEAVIGSLARGFAGRPIHEAVRHRPPPRLLRLLARRLASWRMPADVTGPMLDRLSRHLTVPGLAARPAHWWLAPILIPKAERLIATLRSLGYDATRGTTSMRALVDESGNTPEIAARLIASVVYLPKPRDAAAAERLNAAVERSLGE